MDLEFQNFLYLPELILQASASGLRNLASEMSNCLGENIRSMATMPLYPPLILDKTQLLMGTVVN